MCGDCSKNSMGTVYCNSFLAPERLLLWHEVMATLSNGGHRYNNNKTLPVNKDHTSGSPCKPNRSLPSLAKGKGPCVCAMKQQPKRQLDKNEKHMKDKNDSKMSNDEVAFNINVYDWSGMNNK